MPKPHRSQPPDLLQSVPLSKVRPEQISPLALAYIGDAVYELYVRSQFLFPPKKISRYHAEVVSRVRAESQAAYLEAIAADLTPEELDIVRRGRNAVTQKHKRLSGKIYQQASSLETLIGYLYLSDTHRLEELLAKLNLHSPLDAETSTFKADS